MYWDPYFENLLEIKVKFAPKKFRMTPNIDILGSIFRESLGDALTYETITKMTIIVTRFV